MFCTVDSGGVTLEEQLKLAKEKISNAKQQGAYGSGTCNVWIQS